jgi:hypothetical protein
MRGGLPIPKSVAQLTGVLVTAIVAFGTDIEVYYAVPLGVFAGALAMFFVSLSEAQDAYRERWSPPPEQSSFRNRWDRFK